MRQMIRIRRFRDIRYCIQCFPDTRHSALSADIRPAREHLQLPAASIQGSPGHRSLREHFPQKCRRKALTPRPANEQRQRPASGGLRALLGRLVFFVDRAWRFRLSKRSARCRPNLSAGARGLGRRAQAERGRLFVVRLSTGASIAWQGCPEPIADLDRAARMDSAPGAAAGRGW